MNWIDRYVYAVGEELPVKHREDIQRELRSLIADSLEARTGLEDNWKEEDVFAVLEEFGPPSVAAQQYAPRPNYVVGPALYEAYREVLSILMVIAAAGTVVSVIVDMVRENWSYITLMGSLAGRLFSAGIQMVGWVTMIFMIIQYFSQKDSMDGEGQPEEEVEWDPRDLPIPAQDDKMGLADAGFSLAFSILAVVAGLWLGYQLGWFGGTPEVNLSVLNGPVVLRFLPWWIVLWSIGLVLDMVQLIRRRWTSFTRILALAWNAGCVLLLGSLAAAPLLIGEAFLTLGGPEHLEALEIAARVTPSALRGVFLIMMAITLWESWEHAYALYKTKRV